MRSSLSERLQVPWTFAGSSDESQKWDGFRMNFGLIELFRTLTYSNGGTTLRPYKVKEA